MKTPVITTLAIAMAIALSLPVAVSADEQVPRTQNKQSQRKQTKPHTKGQEREAAELKKLLKQAKLNGSEIILSDGGKARNAQTIEQRAYYRDKQIEKIQSFKSKNKIDFSLPENRNLKNLLKAQSIEDIPEEYRQEVQKKVQKFINSSQNRYARTKAKYEEAGKKCDEAMNAAEISTAGDYSKPVATFMEEAKASYMESHAGHGMPEDQYNNVLQAYSTAHEAQKENNSASTQMSEANNLKQKFLDCHDCKK